MLPSHRVTGLPVLSVTVAVMMLVCPAARDVGSPVRDIWSPPTAVRVITTAATEPATLACTISSTFAVGLAAPAVYTATALPLTSVVPFRVVSVAPLLLVGKSERYRLAFHGGFRRCSSPSP